MTTSVDQFGSSKRVTRSSASQPLVRQIHLQLSPHQAARRLAALPHCLLLESAMRHRKLGRYSFLMAEPVEFRQWHDEEPCLQWLDSRLASFACHPLDALPPFQGGVAGLFAYDFHSAQDPTRQRTQPAAAGRGGCPGAALGIYDTVIAWDHVRRESWIVAHGIDLEENNSVPELAGQKMEKWLDLLLASSADNGTRPAVGRSPSAGANRANHELTSDLSRNDYLRIVQSALQYIHAGDIFQVNLAQQLSCAARSSPLELYDRVREANPATFAAYFDIGPVQIVSGSPERLASVRKGMVETRPIKGTRRRTGEPHKDRQLADELIHNAKERAENIMIVDLMRNDLSRVCTDDSVRVTQLLQLESYASVMHLVSAVSGQLRGDVRAGDLIRAIFPGGSVTGAPKIRAMEIISELEPTPRGAYCGSLGYFGFDGSIDLNILIRTITANAGHWQIPVGGGIVAGSDPQSEYEETWAKARGMIDAIESLPRPN